MRTIFPFLIFLITNNINASDLDQEIQQLELFSETLQIVKKDSVYNINSKNLIKGAIQGILNTLNDPYAKLLTKEQINILNNDGSDKLFGLGLITAKEKNTYKVKFVYPLSPAQNAGLKKNDIILSISNSSIKNHKNVSFISPSFTHPKTIRIEQKEISQKTALIYSRQDINIIKILYFNENTFDEVSHILSKQKMDKLIIDLRDNPGGLLNSVVETLELFLDKGIIVSVETRGSKITKKYFSAGDKKKEFKKLIILINKGSASAAEIFAGAILDRNAGILIGEKSYGKGTVQSIKRINDNYAIKLTTAFYITPVGKKIDKKGVTPDFTIKMKGHFEDYSNDDLVFNKAVEKLRD